MKNTKLSLRSQKFAACLLHLFFLSMMFVGIGLMYLNDNYGVGITKVQNLPYEDTPAFNQQFNTDLNDIFHYIEYSEVFATDGSVDISKTMLQMTFGPNETETFSLSDLIAHLQSLGYQLNDNFEWTGTPDPTLVSKSPTGYVDWSASTPNEIHPDLRSDLRRATLEEISLEIMTSLQRYYSVYNRLIMNPSNLHFKIFYSDPTNTADSVIYTNTPDLTADMAKSYGKYAYLPGNSVFYDTNFKSIALDTISSLAFNNPYDGNSYYLLVSVDTAYPVKDAYLDNRAEYQQMQSHYFVGFVLMMIGALVTVITLLFLMAVSGHKNLHDKTITLHNFDKTSTEVGIFLFSLLTLAGLAVCRFSMVRVSHLFMAEAAWALTERVLYTAVLYLGMLLLFFSLLRRYKADTLWTNSLIYKSFQRFSILFTKQSFAVGLTICFFAYLISNTVLLGTAFILFRKIYMNPLIIKLLLGIVIFAWALLNIWSFYLLFRRAAEHDKIHTAVERLAAGETSYQVNPDDFEGKEWDLAININNISVGLETALQEKVKSERLKSDLITNVSHDIKTPLTSILNYVDLIKREQIQDEKICGYLDVLEQKSQRLKTLTEDLVEASKASSGNLKLEISDIDFIELIYQTNGEFEEKFASRHLELITNAPDETLIIEADGRQLWRVLENLYNNAYKYAMDKSRIYVDIVKEESVLSDHGTYSPKQVLFSIKNISTNSLNIRPEELTERFVRGDVARTTEGSGLGLSIAKSLTELQNGRFEICIDGDLFKVLVAFDIKE
ncbi:MAG: HAMP domain-containing sensor histidine kinase [Clostridium sp.]